MKWLKRRKCKRHGHNWMKLSSWFDCDAEGTIIGSGTVMWFCDRCGAASETDPVKR